MSASQSVNIYETLAARINTPGVIDSTDQQAFTVFIDNGTGVLSFKNSAGTIYTAKAGATVVTVTTP